MTRSHTRPKTPPTLLVWTLHDPVLEQPALLERQFHDIRGAGFGGVATWIRCSRYSWSDPAARRAMLSIDRLCTRHRMAHWIGADPRFVSRELIGDRGGMECILFGDTPRAERFPNFATPDGERFAVRCLLPPRHVHTLTEVAIEYLPLRLAGVFALRRTDPAPGRRDVIDLTPIARMFYHARDRYVEAFGSDPRLARGPWQIVAFFHVRTNHVDFSDASQMARYHLLLQSLKGDGINPDGVMWDEPGFTCTYGTLPYTPSIRRGYRQKTGRPIEKDLWKLAVDAQDGSHVQVRIPYYQEIQRRLNSANRSATRRILHLWGADTVSGIHDTWHFESGDMCDMNHGSLDLWEGMKCKSGGFVDLGGVDQLRDPRSPWYANVAAMGVAAASLGTFSTGGYAYNNLWTVGDDDGEGWQRTILSHCADVLALFGTRWLAHAYGPVGTIGEERTFLGSPPLPGYPDHSTWPGYPTWNKRLASHLTAVGGRPPRANLLVLFPVDTLYSQADSRADRTAGEIFRLLLELLDRHYHPDLLSPSIAASGRWNGASFVVGKRRYDAVVYPYPGERSGPGWLCSGRRRRNLFTIGGHWLHPSALRCDSAESLFGQLKMIPLLRPIAAPERSWCTLTPSLDGTTATLIPSRHGYRYGGRVSLGDREITIPEQTGLCRLFFPADKSGISITSSDD